MHAFLWMSGALMSFSLMAIGAREIAGEINTFEILFFRSLIGLIVIASLIAPAHRRRLFATYRLPIHAVRNVFHFVGQYGWFLGIGLLPLAQVFALEFTTPIWTLFVAALVLKEPLTARKVLAIVLGTLGVYLILNPGTGVVQTAAWYVIGAAICYSVAHVSTKALSTTEHPLTILFYMCLIQLPLGLLAGIDRFVVPTGLQSFWLMVVGSTALTAHFCMAKAMQTADAGVVVTLDFLRLPLIAGVGVVVYGEDLNPWVIVGASCMLIGNLINIARPKRSP